MYIEHPPRGPSLSTPPGCGQHGRCSPNILSEDLEMSPYLELRAPDLQQPGGSVVWLFLRDQVRSSEDFAYLPAGWVGAFSHQAGLGSR